MAERVASMVCVACARVHGQEHAAGCPIPRGSNFDDYGAGWIAARDALLPSLADRIVTLEAALGEALAYRRAGRMPHDVLERLREVLRG